MYNDARIKILVNVVRYRFSIQTRYAVMCPCECTQQKAIQKRTARHTMQYLKASGSTKISWLTSDVFKDTTFDRLY